MALLSGWIDKVKGGTVWLRGACAAGYLFFTVILFMSAKATTYVKVTDDSGKETYVSKDGEGPFQWLFYNGDGKPADFILMTVAVFAVLVWMVERGGRLLSNPEQTLVSKGLEMVAWVLVFAAIIMMGARPDNFKNTLIVFATALLCFTLNETFAFGFALLKHFGGRGLPDGTDKKTDLATQSAKPTKFAKPQEIILH